MNGEPEFWGILPFGEAAIHSGDVLAAGALAYSQQGAIMPVHLANDHTRPIGRARVNTDGRAIRCEIQLADNVRDAADARLLVRAGALRYLVPTYQALKVRGSGGTRHVEQLRLYGVGISPLPMWEGARIQSIRFAATMPSEFTVRDAAAALKRLSRSLEGELVFLRLQDAAAQLAAAVGNRQGRITC